MNSIAMFQLLLARRGCDEQVIAHVKAVTKKALLLSNLLSIPVDRDLVVAGSMLHDIGRSKTHGIRHVVEGAQIVREEGFSEELARIVERHVGAGIPLEEAVRLGLPPKDYLPTTPEEVIVSYADNLTNGTRHVSFTVALQRFKKTLGTGHPAIERFVKQHEQIENWIKRL